jgi:hypothetical protein
VVIVTRYSMVSASQTGIGDVVDEAATC